MTEVPPLHKVAPGMTTCCQFLPPSKLVDVTMPLKPPPIQAATRFFGLVGFTAREVSLSAPLEPQAASASGSERSISAPTLKSFARITSANPTAAATHSQR